MPVGRALFSSATIGFILCVTPLQSPVDASKEALVSEEPEYLQRLRRSLEERTKRPPESQPAAKNAPAYSVQEQEALRWAKQLAGGTELRAVRNLSGSRFAVLVRLQSASGVKFISIEGLPSREALLERVKPGATVGEEVLGAYEVKGGRPITVVLSPDGQVGLKMGEPRPGAHPVSPEKMLRRAAAEAAERAKSRPGRGDRTGRR